MQYQKMTEKFHKEIRVYLRILYILFFLTLLVALLSVSLESSFFTVLFKIGKYAYIVLGGTILCRIWATCEKAVKQHDVLVDLLSEDEKGRDI
ncbi:MAG: hypothetical protein PUC30_04795 [Lachnospiraceae bacterium]|nr:hypothetical protein [Lachnospiraceae bacterium]